MSIKKEVPTVSMASSSAVKPVVNTEVGTTSTLSIMQYCNYVHKLKRARIQTSNDCNDETKAKKTTPSAAGSSDYSEPSTPSNTRATPLPVVYIYNSPKPSMEEVLTRFPHIGEQIFANLDNQNLMKCREVCDPWMTFLNQEKLIWTRIILSYIEPTNSWNWQKFFSTTSTPMLCQKAKRIQQFYKYENTIGIVKEMSPLHFAVMMYDDTKYCVDLIENCTIDHPQNENGTTPLHYAAKYGYACVCQFLLKKFRDKNPKDKANVTPLELGIVFKNYFVCELIIRKCEENAVSLDLSAVLNPLNENGLTPLHLAAKYGKSELCWLIMKNVVDKNPKSSKKYWLNGTTPLHLAADEGHFSVCELMISQNVNNKNPIDRIGRTPLYMAARKGHLSICHLLYEEKYDSDDNELFKLLEAAFHGENIDVCKFFALKVGCKNIEYIDASLRLAASKGNLEICKFIIQNVQIDWRIKCDMSIPTPLSIAARNGHLSICHLLYENSLDIGNYELFQILHEAVKGGHYDVCKYFVLEMRCRVIKYNYFDFALSTAAAKGNLELCLLIIKNLQINEGSELLHDYDTPLHAAAKNGHFEVYKLIMNGFNDKNPKNNWGDTPLHLAAENGHFDICELILLNVENKTPRNDCNKTPMDLAAENNHDAVCDLFIQRSLRNCQEKTSLLFALKSGRLYTSALTDSARTRGKCKKYKSSEIAIILQRVLEWI